MNAAPPAASSLSVVMPAYNEAENVEAAVTRMLAVLERLVESYEVLVVDDGSRDATAAVVDRLVAEHDGRVRLVKHAANRGYGAALRSGFDRARHELVFYTDSDNQFDVAELAYFVPLIGEYDMVVGFRVYRYDSVLRLMASWIYNHLVRVIFRVRVRDVDCAFKLFRREVIDKIDIDCTDFFVDTEIVARARKWNFRIVEKGVRHYPRTAGETTVHPGDVPRTLRTLVRMFQRIYFPSRAQLERAEAARAEAREAAVEVAPAAG